MTDFLEQLVSQFFHFFRAVSKALGDVALTIVDVAISGIVLYVMFKDMQHVNGTFISLGISLAMTAVSIQLWREVKRGLSPTPRLVIIILLQPIDIMIDLAIMEMVYGTGDVWLFGTKQAFQAVHRPLLWWLVTIAVGVLTTMNEYIVAGHLENGKKERGRTAPFRLAEHGVMNARTNGRNVQNVRERFVREQNGENVRNDKVGLGSIDWQAIPAKHRDLVQYCVNYYNSVGGEWPSYSQVMNKLPAYKSKSQLVVPMNALKDGKYFRQIRSSATTP
jgi:hypothetical protein